jgi:O-antigen ligase
MRRAGLVLAWGSAVVAVAAFFLPWATMEVREHDLARDLTKALGGRVTVQIHRGGETIAGELPDLSAIPRVVSGVQIPQVANSQDAKVAMALFEIVTDNRQHLGFKSYAVYLVPGVALVAALLLTVLRRRRAFALGVALLCAAIASAGGWKLLTTDTSTLLVAVAIGPGLWLSVWAYAALSLAAFIDTLSPRPL